MITLDNIGGGGGGHEGAEKPLIKTFFQVKDAKETGKLESSDRLNLDADNAGLGGAAAGVGLESEAGPSQENERRKCRKNT